MKNPRWRGQSSILLVSHALYFPTCKLSEASLVGKKLNFVRYNKINIGGYEKNEVFAEENIMSYFCLMKCVAYYIAWMMTS